MATSPEILTHYINGQRVAGESNRFGDIFNPATGEVAARAPYASSHEVRTAIESAKAAFPAWSGTPPAQR